MDYDAYGSGAATGHFNYVAFIKQPRVIIRAISWVFSIIVFGCISSQGYYEDHCQFNNDPHACGFGIFVGVIAFLGLVGLLISDALFDNISNVQQRKYVVIGDIIFSGFWAFMWFVCFCYLADTWRRTPGTSLPNDGFGKSGVEAAIAFSFFSTATFVALTIMAVMRYRAGIADEAFLPSGGGGMGYDYEGGYAGGIGGGASDPGIAPPLSGYTEPQGGTYQQAPFGGPPQEPKRPLPGGEYQGSAY